MHLFDLNAILTTIGFAGILAIIFAETGLFIGFFLPGDSLLFTAGLLASQGVFNIWALCIAAPITAIAGYALGYWFGGHLGRWLLAQPDRWYFKKSYYDRSQAFFDRHGGKALILARLMPIVRTFVPIVAGVSKMNWRRYMFFNISGGAMWGIGMPLLGFYLGHAIPNAKKYLLPIVCLVVVISLLPAVWHYYADRKKG